MVLLTLSPNQETVKMQMHFLHPLAPPGSAWDFGTTRYWNAGFATFFCLLLLLSSFFPTFHRFLIVFQRWLNSKAASLITHQFERSSLGNFGRDLISFRIQMRQTWADWGRERSMNDEFSSRKSLYSKKYEATTVTTLFKRIFILKGAAAW